MTNKKKIIIGFLAVAMLAIIAVVAYMLEVNKYDKPEVTITFAPKWVHQAQFAGIYTAIEKGFYQKKGINVEFTDYEPTNPPFAKIQSGEADFGLMNASGVLKEASQGNEISALAVFFQHSPYAIISLEGRGIHTPWELKDKKVGIKGGTGSENQLVVELLLESAGLSIDDVRLVDLDLASDEREDLTSERADAVGFYRTRIYQFEKEGLAYDVVQPEQYGIGSYNDVLVADPEFVQRNPDLTSDFIEATIQGWEYVFDNKEEAIDITLKYVKREDYQDRDYLRSIITESEPLIKPSSRFSIGSMSVEKWQRLANTIFADSTRLPLDTIVNTDHLP